MTKKERQRKKSVYISQEGDREEFFLRFLQEMFDLKRKVKLNFSQEKGGNSNAILDRALKSFYPVSYAWFDEDDELDKEHKKELEKRWHLEKDALKNIADKNLQSHNKKSNFPIIIVSSPYSVEGILIRLFNKKFPSLIVPVKSKKDFEENKKRMKNSVDGFIGKMSDIEYYRKNLTKTYILEKSKEIEELKILLTIFDVK